MAEQVAPVFTEVVVAPGFEPAALELLSKKKNIRLLTGRRRAPAGRSRSGRSAGGLLVQQADRPIDAAGDDPTTWTLAAGEAADAATLADLAFAWRAVRAVKSNAILLASDGASVGVGMGQVNRVDSCRLAVERAGAGTEGRARGSVAASDAFFPFADGLQVLLDAGVRAVVQPGGSIRDDRGDRGRQGSRRDHVLHRHPPLRALTHAQARASRRLRLGVGGRPGVQAGRAGAGPGEQAAPPRRRAAGPPPARPSARVLGAPGPAPGRENHRAVQPARPGRVAAQHDLVVGAVLSVQGEVVAELRREDVWRRVRRWDGVVGARPGEQARTAVAGPRSAPSQ